MIEDTELLRRYAEEHSEAAFNELMERRLGLVYAVAWRQTSGDAHRAQDIAQTVFIKLARKASSLARQPVLTSAGIVTTIAAVPRNQPRNSGLNATGAGLTASPWR